MMSIIILDKENTEMEKIFIEKKEPKSRNRRATVVIKPETYKKISDLSFEANQPVETIVELLLSEALKYVEIKEN